MSWKSREEMKEDILEVIGWIVVFTIVIGLTVYTFYIVFPDP